MTIFQGVKKCPLPAGVRRKRGKPAGANARELKKKKLKQNKCQTHRLIRPTEEKHKKFLPEGDRTGTDTGRADSRYPAKIGLTLIIR